MSKKHFNEADREHLSRNKHVLRISDKAITYSDEFKQLFIDQYITGRSPREIFEANGFDVRVIGMKRVNSALTVGRKPIDVANRQVVIAIRQIITRYLKCLSFR
ncbi:HTH domain-containing protein [Paenibacillus prosopidis]|uniref:Uncharacterized protein n=1 Tax=Paenibacillus prosopidis TaxID=630520 RepID=A0A368WA85_9BACL|nr:HTH domain-containing protein [Paenibacillus prosopidis]RCW52006.1 hypothetical protein DFP97_101352 [Paenibacillus prosopidis]